MLMKFVLESIFSVSIDLRLSISYSFPMNWIHPTNFDPYEFHAFLHCFFFFYEMIRRPYILESYIIDILLLSFSHLSIYRHPSILIHNP